MRMNPSRHGAVEPHHVCAVAQQHSIKPKGVVHTLSLYLTHSLCSNTACVCVSSLVHFYPQHAMSYSAMAAQHEVRLAQGHRAGPRHAHGAAHASPSAQPHSLLRTVLPQLQATSSARCWLSAR